MSNDPWAAAFFGMSPDQRFVLLLVIIGCLTGAVIALAGILTGLATTIQRRTSETQLKREMLDRGMSAEEISEVIRATPPTDFIERWADNHKSKGRQA